MKRRLSGVAAVLLAAFAGACRKEAPPLVIACAGDSLMRPVPAHLERLLPESAVPRFALHEWARGGLTVAGFRNFLGRHAETWNEARADVVFVQLGTNDVPRLLSGDERLRDFKTGLTAVIRRFKGFRTKRGDSPLVIVATVPYFADGPADSDKNRYIAETLNPALRDVVERAGACLADSFAVLEGRPDLYDPDGVHPNTAGEIALTRNWIRTLKDCRDR
ncbi:MAG: SGNH/GDSL hydrolase family protein [Candidatus Aminicenantes bacterium]|nr:SGNH/GDSL hydrolase family protein [Candidatus Aminicenantes bacterium]